MYYSRWATEKEIEEVATKINVKGEVKESGLQIGHDQEELLIDNDNGHNLVVGSTGSGKTQVAVLPLLRLSIKANESFVITDPKGELYKKIGSKVKEEGYKTYVLDFDDTRYGNSWNILRFPYSLYKEGNIDECITQIERLSHYIFFEKSNGEDPFWINSCKNYFTGMCLYLFQEGKEEEINLLSLYNLCNKAIEDKTLIDKIKDNISISSGISAVLKAPSETKGSILAVFNQKIRNYISRDNLTKLLSLDDLDINNIFNEKTAIFIIGRNNTSSYQLIPLFIDQYINSALINKKDNKKINLILDEFDNMIPINNFSNLLGDSRGLGIRFSVIIRSYKHLSNLYKKDEVELLKIAFSTIIYLLSNDIYTLDEISFLCGNKSKDERLISIEELKLLKNFEAIIIKLRMYPIRTKLLPDYKIDYGYETKEIELELREDKEIKVI